MALVLEAGEAALDALEGGRTHGRNRTHRFVFTQTDIPEIPEVPGRGTNTNFATPHNIGLDEPWNQHRYDKWANSKRGREELSQGDNEITVQRRPDIDNAEEFPPLNEDVTQVRRESEPPEVDELRENHNQTESDGGNILEHAGEIQDDHVPGENLLEEAQEVPKKGILSRFGKRIQNISTGAGVASHGASHIIGSSISAHAGVKTAEINQQTAENVAKTKLEATKITNQTSADIAKMQNDSNLWNKNSHDQASLANSSSPEDKK